MPAKDGLLVRLRISGGVLTAAKALALADLAESCGNGQLGLSSRANLQIRGVREDTLGPLQDGLSTLGLIDPNGDAEAVRNVIASPLAGLHDGPDIRPIVLALEARLIADTRLHALPPKFGFLVDDGSRPSLAAIDADVRFDWNGRCFEIGLGGTRRQAVRAGRCDAAEIPARATQAAGAFLAIASTHAGTRRVRHVAAAVARAVQDGSPLDADDGSNGVETVRDSNPADVASSSREDITAQAIVGVRTLSAPALGLAAPFGSLDAAMLRAAARLAQSTPFGELRLTPWRALLVPGVDAVTNVPGFISDPSDRRLAIAACIGQSGCARATTNTLEDAASLAAYLPQGAGISLHVSGCEKGCAKPSSTAMTLVGREGRYDVVRRGSACDAPWRRDLDREAVRAVLGAPA